MPANTTANVTITQAWAELVDGDVTAFIAQQNSPFVWVWATLPSDTGLSEPAAGVVGHRVNNELQQVTRNDTLSGKVFVKRLSNDEAGVTTTLSLTYE